MLIPGQTILAGDAGISILEGETPGITAEVAFCQGDQRESIRFRLSLSSPVMPPLAREALLPLILVPAMRLGAPIHLEGGPVSAGLLAGIERFQEVFATWYPEFSRVPVSAAPAVLDAPGDDRRGVGLFLSGGVDSLYTLLKHRGEITHAIFVHGCDIPLENHRFRERVVGRLRELAENIGVELVEVETDLLGFSDRYCHWGYHYHGAGLTAIAMLLSGSLRKVYLASSDYYSNIVPWGSTSLTDHLWNTPLLEMVNDGAERDRIGKLTFLSREPGVLRHLRVCFQNPDDGVNCGRCEKCQRTMVALRILGLEEKEAPVFGAPLDLEAMVESREAQRAAETMLSWRGNLREAERRNNDPELVAALRALLQRRLHDRLLRELATHKEAITTSPQWRAALPKFRSTLVKSLLREDPDWFVGFILKQLPSIRERVFARLWNHDRAWFRMACRKAAITRLMGRLRRRRR